MEEGAGRGSTAVPPSRDPVEPERVDLAAPAVVELPISALGATATNTEREQAEQPTTTPDIGPPVIAGPEVPTDDPQVKQASAATRDERDGEGQPLVVGTRRANRRVLTPFLPADARAVLDQRAVGPAQRLPRGELVVEALRREYEGIVRDFRIPDDMGGFADPPKRRRRHLKEPVQVPLTLTEQQASFLAEQVALTQLSVSAFLTEALLRYVKSERERT
ncbi:MAG: hypothetical protein ACYCTE_11240 [Acidimicrobiales bacterium]